MNWLKGHQIGGLGSRRSWPAHINYLEAISTLTGVGYSFKGSFSNKHEKKRNVVLEHDNYADLLLVVKDSQSTLPKVRREKCITAYHNKDITEKGNPYDNYWDKFL